MEVDNDSSDSDGYGYGNNQEAIVIPIRRRNDQAAPAEVEGFSTDNGVTMINFAKSKQVVCDKCSVSLKSMKPDWQIQEDQDKGCHGHMEC